MLVVLQFPFADLRGFLPDTGRLSKPGWPLPEVDTEYIRRFGPVRARPRGGVPEWGEDAICEDTRALRFQSDLSVRDLDYNQAVVMRCAFRRLYFDGSAVAKYEVGVGAKQRGFVPSQGVLMSVLGQVLRLPVSVGGGKEHCSLIQARRRVCQLYARATTRPEVSDEVEPWWVPPGAPVLILVYRSETPLRLPYWTRQLAPSDEVGFSLFHCVVPWDGANLRLWVLHLPTGRAYGRVRREVRGLRISLLRLHAEHECLRLVLRAMMDGHLTTEPRSPKSDALQRYLGEAVTRISRLESNAAGRYPSDMVELAREALSQISPGERNTLASMVDRLDFRPNIRRRVGAYADGAAGSSGKAVIYVEGDLVQGDKFSNSGNAGIVGRDIEVSGGVVAGQVEHIALADGLASLHQHLVNTAAAAEHPDDVKAVAAAEAEARQGDAQKATSMLANIGRWVLEEAKAVGNVVAIAALKKALGLP